MVPDRFFRKIPTNSIDNCRKNDTERGSDGSAASGGESDLSEWQRSTDAKALRRRRQMSGTATGQESNEKHRTVHELSAAALPRAASGG